MRIAQYKDCICIICGQEFSIHICPSHANRGRFCSRKCANAGNIKHGHSPHGTGTPTYYSWCNMRQRCLNPKHPKFARYGGAGITVDDRWSIFANFLEDMGERPEGTTLDRKDGTKGYFKENCRWATPQTQQRNLKTNRWITFNGETLCLTDWARRMGVNTMTLKFRLKKGWGIEKALTTPRQECGRALSKSPSLPAGD